MQDTPLSRWLPPLMAFGLSFVIIASLAPLVGIQTERQLDFWLLWFVTMIFLALPIGYLEIALAKRSKTTALNALSSLTRDADASPRWRLVGWLAVVFIPFLAGGLLSQASQLLVVQAQLTGLSSVVLAGLAVLALALSVVPRLILMGLMLLGVILSLIFAQVMGTQLPAWQMTSLEFSEWGSATVLALVASGLGLGLYWQTTLPQVKQQEIATKSALPIWIAQLLAVVAFAFFATKTQLPAFSLTLAAVMASALMIQLAREQLAGRQIAMVLQWVIVVVALGVWAIPEITVIFNVLLLLWGLIICLIYAIFAGWIMKISHLRKSMNFSNELFYNLWRIAVRVILPLSIILAIISVVLKALT